jgi:FAD/FMN-containing dehydrogenase
MLNVAAIAGLEGKLLGQLLTPDTTGYDATRKVFNGMVDKRPALIARCTSRADVATCINFARDLNVPLSVRGGGHNFAGKSVVEGGLMLDLSLMKAITVDTRHSVARAQAGLILGEFDRETQKHQLATTLGVATTTGISGLTLGGGYGWLAGKYGLACDNLIRAEIVTADGSVRECSARENPDLFWGLRGAGANFGVVTELEYTLHPLSTVLGGPIFYPLTREIFRFYDEFARSAPDELTTLGAAMTGPDGSPAFATVVCYCGPPAVGEKLLEPLRTFGTPVADLIQQRPYLEMQSLFDPMNPPGRRYYNKAHNISEINAGVIDAVMQHMASAPTPSTMVAFQQLHGAAVRVPADETAFPHRYDHHVVWINPIGDDPADDQRMIRWGRECWEGLQPFADRAVYVNALEDALEDGERPVLEVYGANYERLRSLKQQYDPSNLFRLNSNIAPGAI